MSSKPRPANAAGPNGLRGGIKMYSTKTITGPWLEELGGPAGFKRGFTTVDYETECQHQQLGATLKPQPFYGSGLPDDRLIGRATSPFKYEETGANPRDAEPSPWLTSSQLMTRSILVRDREKEEATALKPKMPQDQLENYRKTWTTEENDKMRDLRFSTEARRAAAHAVSKHFAVPSVRFLPGTPKSLENCRSQLVEKYGIFAFAVIREALGKKGNEGMVGLPEFRLAIHDAGVEMKLYEINQMIAYITPSATVIPIEKFLYTLRGTVQGFEKNMVENIFHKISALHGDKRRVPLSALESAINIEEYPEILQGFSSFASSYSITKEDFNQDEFVEMLNEMYLASPALFHEAISNMWIL